MAATEPSLILSFSEASGLVREHAANLRFTYSRRTEVVPLLDCLGRVLARPILADRDQPPFHRSTRDGYACHASDLTGPDAISIAGQIRAGDPSDTGRLALPPRQAFEIMTGAPLPRGADCVAMQEHVEFDVETQSFRLSAGRAVAVGENIVRAGTEAGRGEVVLHSGTRVQPAHIAVAAACGAALLTVYAPPRVSILATGDELVDLDTPPQPHQIRNSNTYSLAAQVMSAGGLPNRLPTVKDDPGSIKQAIRGALDCDLLLLSGGVSMGKYDFVEEALLAFGAKFFFTGAQIQPGRPVVFGSLPHPSGQKYFFGLPGNPVSTLVTFALFAHPLLCALAGEDSNVPRFAQARLASGMKAKPGLTRFLPAILSGSFPPEVTPVEWHGSGDVASTALSNCFVVVPPELEAMESGETVSVLLA